MPYNDLDTLVDEDGKYGDLSELLNDRVLSEGKSDQYIKDLNLSRNTGLSTDVVSRNFKDVEGKVGEKRLNDTYQRLKTEAPGTAKLLEDPVYSPAVKDDVESLAKIETSQMSYWERWKGDFEQSIKQGIATKDLGEIGFKDLVGEELTSFEINRLNQINSGQKVDYDIGFVAGIPGAVSEMIPAWYEAVKDSVPVATAAAVSAGGIALALGQAGPQAAIPEEVVTVPGSALWAGSTALSLNVGIEFAKLEGGAAFLEYKKFTDVHGNKIDIDAARGAAIVTGSINGLLERLGFNKLIKQFPGSDKVLRSLSRDGMRDLLKYGTKTEIFKKIGRNFLSSAATEGVTEFTQEMVTDVVGEISKSMSGEEFQAFEGGNALNYIVNNTDKYLESGIRGAQGGGGFSAMGSAVTVSVDAVSRNMLQKRETAQIQETIESVKNSQLHKSDPGLFAEVTEKSLGKQNVYINSDQANTLFQEDPDKFAELIKDIPEIKEQMDEALQVGGKLVLPANKVYSSLAKNSDVAELLGEHLSLTPESLTNMEFNDTLMNEVMPELNSVVIEDQEAFDDLIGLDSKSFEEVARNQEETIQVNELKAEESQGQESYNYSELANRARQSKIAIDQARGRRGELFSEGLEERISEQLRESGTTRKAAQAQATVPRAAYEALAERFKNNPEQLDILRRQFENTSIQRKDQSDLLVDRFRARGMPTDQQVYGPTLIESVEGLQGPQAIELAINQGFVKNKEEYLDAINQDTVYSRDNLNERLLEEQIKLKAVEDADKLSDFDLKKQINKVTYDQPAINQTDSGVSFNQDFGDLMIEENFIVEETAEDIKLEVTLQSAFDEKVKTRKALGKLIECLS